MSQGQWQPSDKSRWRALCPEPLVRRGSESMPGLPGPASKGAGAPGSWSSFIPSCEQPGQGQCSWWGWFCTEKNQAFSLLLRGTHFFKAAWTDKNFCSRLITVHHSKMMPCFYGVTGFFHKLYWLWTYSCIFRLSFHSQQLSFPWICAANHTFQHPAFLHNRRHTTQAGVCRAVAQTVHSVYFVLFSLYNLLTLSCFPQTVCCILFSPLKVPFCPGWFPHCEGSGFSWMWELLLTFIFLPELLVPFLISLFIFSFFFPTQLWGDFSCPFRHLKSSANPQQVFCETVPLIDIFFMYLWGEMNLHLLILPSWLLPPHTLNFF